MPTTNQHRSRKITRRTQQQPSNSTNDTIVVSARNKKEFLLPYINESVQMKLNNDKKLSRNAYVDVISKLNNLGITWLTVDALKHRVARAYKKATIEVAINPADPPSAPPVNSEDARVSNANPPPPDVNPSDITSNLATIRKRGGRPKGSTDELKSHTDKCVHAAKNEITELYCNEYIKHKESSEINGASSMKIRVPKGTFEAIHEKVKKERNLPSSFSFSYNACQKRILTSNLQISDPGKKSPVADLEPHFITLLLAMADTGCPLSVGQCLPLMNSLIQKNASSRQTDCLEKDTQDAVQS